jgi:hypothetical protein
LLVFFQKHTGPVCGSFTSFQTARVIAGSIKLKKLSSFPKVAASLVGLLVSLADKAQTTDSWKTKPSFEITPLSPKPVTTTIEPASTQRASQPVLPGIQLQGKLGGVSVVVIEKKDYFRHTLYTHIEDMLRHF